MDYDSFYFMIMPKVLSAIKEDIDFIKESFSREKKCRYMDCILLVEGIADILRFDTATDTLFLIMDVSQDDDQIEVTEGVVLSDREKIIQVKIPLPSFLIK